MLFSSFPPWSFADLEVKSFKCWGEIPSKPEEEPLGKEEIDLFTWDSFVFKKIDVLFHSLDHLEDQVFGGLETE